MFQTIDPPGMKEKASIERDKSCKSQAQPPISNRPLQSNRWSLTTSTSETSINEY